MNQPKENDFYLDLGVGKFRFNRKTYGSQIRIDSEISRILGPNTQGRDQTMDIHATLVGTYNALMVECPPSWEDLEAIDLTETPEREEQIIDLWIALRGKLHSFRRSGGASPAVEGEGNGIVQNPGVLATA